MDSTGIPAHTKRMGWGGRGRIIYQVLLLCVFVFETVPKVEILGGGFINNCLFFVYFCPDPWGRGIPISTSIFFRWVGSDHQL